MTQQNYIPADYKRIKVVEDLPALLMEEFGSMANVILCPRRINGDFDSLARVMAAYFNLGREEIFIKYKNREKLFEFYDVLEDESLKKSLEIIMNDLEFFHSAGARAHVRLLRGYNADQTTHGFHIDGLNQDFDRIMTCYNAPVTEYVRNDDVVRLEGHIAVLKKGAKIYSFQMGDVWKQRIRNKADNTLLGKFLAIFEDKSRRAFVHRARKSKNPRLIMVADMNPSG